jgi:hypothetical protein
VIWGENKRGIFSSRVLDQPLAESDDRMTSTKFGVMTGPLAVRERADHAAASGLLLPS